MPPKLTIHITVTQAENGFIINVMGQKQPRNFVATDLADAKTKLKEFADSLELPTQNQA